MRTRTFSGNQYSAYMNVGLPIRLPSPGTYQLQLYTFIHCGIDDCSDAMDSITIKIKETDVYRAIYTAGYQQGRNADKQWIFETVTFDAQSTQIFVNFFTLNNEIHCIL